MHGLQRKKPQLSAKFHLKKIKTKETKLKNLKIANFLCFFLIYT